MRSHPEVLAQDYAIHDATRGQSLVGRVLDRGLSDEHADRHYLIVEATDGRTHFVDLGQNLGEGARRGGLVRISSTEVGLRQADRTIAEVAAAYGGRYSVDLHLAHDPAATDRFAQGHERRLEALRRDGASVTRAVDGRWTVGPDYLDQALRHEQRQAIRQPVKVEVLADRPLEKLVHHDGPTWLDRQCIDSEPERLQGRMGGEVETALGRRRQWLIGQGLAEQDGDTVRYRSDLIATLRQRELGRVGAQLSGELGLRFAPMEGGRVEGIYRQAVEVGGEKYAVIAKSKEFTLVPWRPVLEKQLGRSVAGIIERSGRIDWSFGRQRSGPQIG